MFSCHHKLKCKYEQNIFSFKKWIYGNHKMRNLMIMSNLFKKLQKTHAKKLSSKKWQKNSVFDFCYCVQKFSAYNLFLVFVCTLHRLKVRIKFCLLWLQYQIFEEIFFAYISQSLTKLLEKTKTYFRMCPRILIYIYFISGLWGSILPKKSQNLCTLTTHTYITFPKSLWPFHSTLINQYRHDHI